MARIPKEYRFSLTLSLVLHVLFLIGFVAMTMAEKPARLEKPVETRVTVALQETSTAAPSQPAQESKPEPTRPPATKPPRSTAPPEVRRPVEKPRVETPKPTPKPEPTPKPKPTKTPRPKPTEKPKATPAPTTSKPTTAAPTKRPTTAPPTTTARNQPTVEELRRRMEEKGVKSPSRDYPDPNKNKKPAPTARTPDRSTANNASKPSANSPTKVDNTSASWNHVGLPDYYAQSALNKVSRLFRVPPSEQRAVVALLSVRIDRSGTLSSIRVAKSSGDAKLDAYAVKALEAAKSFPPLPDSFPRNNVEVEISFSFVQD